jgi:hypothetical protein
MPARAKMSVTLPTAVSMFVAAGLSLTLNGPCHAQQSMSAAPMPPAAQEILSRMDKELAATHTKAIRDLEKVLKETTKKGDLAGAMTVKQEIDRLQREIVPSGTAQQLVGRWQVSSGSSVELLTNGIAKSQGGVAGQWSFDGGVLLLQFSSGTRYQLRPTAEGMVGIRTGSTGERSESVWKRMQ